ncbi:hypothetical protein T4B_14291 [Trichinella pseudospiralis]|uniref:Uncharacterized protein n=1 Tax=Trichinella pseudospiralis TaxID=6337 RepID=A0A0V1IEM9_TRIPS|nr:hypothetical protein T4B_14291 [Trichinella pseudospiralis]
MPICDNGARDNALNTLYLRHFPQIHQTSHFQGIDHRLTTTGLFGQWLLPFEHQQQRWRFPYLPKGLCTTSDGHWR